GGGGEGDVDGLVGDAGAGPERRGVDGALPVDGGDQHQARARREDIVPPSRLDVDLHRFRRNRHGHAPAENLRTAATNSYGAWSATSCWELTVAHSMLG